VCLSDLSRLERIACLPACLTDCLTVVFNRKKKRKIERKDKGKEEQPKERWVDSMTPEREREDVLAKLREQLKEGTLARARKERDSMADSAKGLEGKRNSSTGKQGERERGGGLLFSFLFLVLEESADSLHPDLSITNKQREFQRCKGKAEDRSGACRSCSASLALGSELLSLNFLLILCCSFLCFYTGHMCVSCA